jgi:BMFP domain-containing protein YqiC
MQKDSKLFDDLARMMSGATNMAFDMKREMEATVARQMEAFLGKTSLVTREEFEALKTMTLKAREENDALRKELEALRASSASPASVKPAKASKKVDV